jgi:PilZ domain
MVLRMEMGREAVSQSRPTGVTERRRSARIDVPFPATVEGVDVDGDAFLVTTVLDNLCKEGVYLRLIPCVQVGSDLSISVAAEIDSPRVSVRGQVMRVELKDGGACGVAVKIHPARFL